MSEQALYLGYNLLKDLGIHHMTVLPDHYELKHEFDNQAIIAFGQTQEELVENFYHLYQELINPE